MESNKNSKKPEVKQTSNNEKNKEKSGQTFERHFRIYLVSSHPAFIIDEEGEYYYFHRVTSSPKSGHHKNWEINPNPDTKRKTPMYIVKMEQKDKKKRFSKKLKYTVDLVFIERKSD